MSISTTTARPVRAESTTDPVAAAAALAREHSRVTRRRIAIVAGLILVALAAFVVSVIVGAAPR